MSKRLLIGLALTGLIIGGAMAQVVPSPGPPTAIACAYNAAKPTLTDGQAGWVQCDSKGALVANSSVASGSAVTASATGTTLATTATIAAVANVTNYICGFSIRANATAAATGTATITGVITATMSFVQWTAPLASNIGIIENTFNPCIPASAANTAIAVISAAPGAGGTVSVTAWGFRQ